MPTLQKKIILSLLALLIIGLAFFKVSSQKIDKLYVAEINQKKQWLLVRGENKKNLPVLFIHGGPSFPLMPFSRSFDQYFIKDFTIIHWDQPGSGKSKEKNLNRGNFNYKQLVSDGLEVTKHLLKTLKQEKLILVSHSAGSIIASKMIEQEPRLFKAYVAFAPVVDYKRAEQLRYKFVKENIEQSRESRNKRLYLVSFQPHPTNLFMIF